MRDLKVIIYGSIRFFKSPASLFWSAVTCLLIFFTFGFSERIPPGVRSFASNWCDLMESWGVAFGLTGVIGGASVGRPRYFAHALVGGLSFLVGAAIGSSLWVWACQMQCVPVDQMLVGAISPFLIGGALFGIGAWLLQKGAQESYDKPPRN
jgi:hypothetical protein